MAARNPRLSIVVEPHIYKLIAKLAKKDDTSISKKAMSLLVEALDLQEDLGLSHLAESREKTLEKGKLVPHEDAW
ncbi:MAG: toxin-antitoxin system, antitoxin component [Deltaproteobacteria bacterium]|nr:MAG: toxin-antitoxin system, antitoxin component [Deltaproteobacteria bacterium]